MFNISRLLIAVLMVSILSGCGSVVGQKGPYGAFSPMPILMRHLPQGEDDFSIGFRDGCYNFMGQNGFGMMRIYDKQPHPTLKDRPLYRQGYVNGDRYCGVYVNKYIIL